MPRLRRIGQVSVVVLAATVDLLVWRGARDLRGGGTLPFWVVPTLTVVVYPVLLFRWRRPVEVFAVLWTYGLAGLIVPLYGPFAGLLVALHAVACRTRTRVAVSLFAACTIPFGINTYNNATTATGDNFFAILIVAGVLWAAFSATIWGLGRFTYLAERRSRLMRALQAKEAEDAVRTERLRLARELHDIVAHAVSAMILQAAGTRALMSPHQDEHVRKALTVIESVGVQAMNELHRLLGLLRSVDPDRADSAYEQPGLDDVPALIELSRDSDLEVEAIVEGRPAQLDRSVDLAAYRVIQESLTNATKYGGRATSVRIHVGWGQDHVMIAVRNTRGAPMRDVPVPPQMISSGHGLLGLAERISLLGGRLEAGPDSNGFLVRAELPLSRAEQASVAAEQEGDR